MKFFGEYLGNISRGTMVCSHLNSKAPFLKAYKVLFWCPYCRFFPNYKSSRWQKNLLVFCGLIRISLRRLSFKLSEQISRRKYPLLLQKANET